MASMTAAQTAFAGTRVESATRSTPRASRAALRCQAVNERSSRRELLGLGAVMAAVAVAPAATAGVVEDLLAKSEANKALNDRKRLLTSYANLERSRTVADGTCAFPKNAFGCDIEKVAGNVPFITEDIKIECQGNEPGKCASQINMLKVAPK
ncbi:hypothetical protein BSKO_03536 [Bryopsis sp. KO-2023]|nr:hypothetical protein BSKO_03536 [Bryopsis sp. KO-2023]